jgi:hypothetical protein
MMVFGEQELIGCGNNSSSRSTNNNIMSSAGGAGTVSTNGSSSSDLLGPLVILNKNLTMKQILAMIFFPVAIPYLVYKFVSAFRKQYGLKSRALEGKVILKVQKF